METLKAYAEQVGAEISAQDRSLVAKVVDEPAVRGESRESPEPDW